MNERPLFAAKLLAVIAACFAVTMAELAAHGQTDLPNQKKVMRALPGSFGFQSNRFAKGSETRDVETEFDHSGNPENQSVDYPRTPNSPQPNTGHSTTSRVTPFSSESNASKSLQDDPWDFDLHPPQQQSGAENQAYSGSADQNAGMHTSPENAASLTEIGPYNLRSPYSSAVGPYQDQYPLYGQGQTQQFPYDYGANAPPQYGQIPSYGRAYQGVQTPTAPQLNPQRSQDLFVQNMDNRAFWNQFPSTPPEKPDATPEGYESIGAIIANGYVYGRIELAIWEPHFRNNVGLSIQQGPLTTYDSFDFGFEFTPRYVLGFETNAGPGIELVHWKFNEFSDLLAFAGDGISTAEIFVLPAQGTSPIVLTAGAGQAISARHDMNVHSTTINFFKAYQAPVTKFRGLLGFRYATFKHVLLANASSGESLLSDVDFVGGGPNLGIDYERPIGHTSLKLLGGFGSSLLFGDRQHRVFESGLPRLVERRTDHPLTVLDIHGGIEWHRKIARCNSIAVRALFESQYWIGGGSAVDPTSDFGLYGMVISVGITR
ncbi:MAG TPA: Lpg1974 family pore-forming outer membrane protein [Pirellulaceae bacterium]|nr:Lpg1974 family pore-forming outer membrane protein [Pirellulaceae bacterium]HMO93113.1 Lpg1974 family pore-forming outer membrane protein [Pirellulaceae bacterium]HMP70328.1 Lpg1974 family pore-forming outer membrane protein [Pirellulaceae bacterium]